MSATSDERREVAEQLRKAADSDEWLDVSVANAIFRAIGGVKRPIAEILADLIDPTCHVTCKGSFTAHHDFTRWECSECGAYAFAPGKLFAPRYCAHCGARFVNDGEVTDDGRE